MQVEHEKFMVWKAQYSVGVQLIDEQHKELVKMTNILYEDCAKYGKDIAYASFKVTIKAAVEYVTKHFATEEQIMERIAYPDFAKHKAEHQEFVKQVLADIKKFEEGRAFVPNTFVHFLHDWILSHIAMTDKALGKYLVAMHLAQKSAGGAVGGTTGGAASGAASGAVGGAGGGNQPASH
ncbi:MAG: bacteriohemerythrin [Spirochaetes bacterium]|nr:bacteriohemerythrin [Spirochaetota bacterium]